MTPQIHPQDYYQHDNNTDKDNGKMNMNTSNAGTTTDTSPTTAETTTDSKSISSRSTRSRGSAVLRRAREYNRIIDENRSRSKSFEREQKNRGGASDLTPEQSQRERAMASVKNESMSASTLKSSRPTANAVRSQGHNHANTSANTGTANPNRFRSSPTPSQKSSQRYSRSPPRSKANHSAPSQTASAAASRSSRQGNGTSAGGAGTGQAEKSAGGKSNRGPTPKAEEQAIVTPELLVDALSGHEDGLLAIAERLMEHYDSGYDAMGEAIIDAFADVQKLFQHVVEAAHMEGAAYEAGRKEEEIERLKRALGGEGGAHASADFDSPNPNRNREKGAGANGAQNDKSQNPTSPLRHEEFIDQDVRDVLMEAIRKGQAMKDSNKYADCFQIYENACNSASALLPVDSDHRGRLQLSIARAESMSPERACAILRYVMDDVLRSGLNSNSKVVMPDPSQRGDCVLSKPERAGSSRFPGGQGVSAADDPGVLQSSEEALECMIEEMKEIVSAPVFENTPLQSVAERFWVALADAKRSNLKNVERLEHELATLKADLLMAREEWEEKNNTLAHECNYYKKKADKLKQSKYMEQARAGVATLGTDYSSEDDRFMDPQCPPDIDSPRPTHVSNSSSFVSLSQHAKSIVGSFGCSGRKGSKSRRDSSPPSAASTYTSRKTMSSNSHNIRR